MKDKNVVLYTTKLCPVCEQIKKLLNKNNIRYEVIDDEDYLRSQNILAVPVLEVDGKRMGSKAIYDWIAERGANVEN